MTHSVVTGAGLVTPLGIGCGETVAALRAGRCAAPQPGRATVELAARVVDEALGERVRAHLGARPADWRGTGKGVRAGLLAALEAAHEARLADPALPRDRVGLIVAGHNLTAELGAGLAGTFAREPAYVPPSAAVRMWDTDTIGLVSRMLGLAGETALVGGASASGLIAVIQAHRLVVSGDVDACLVVAPALELAAWQQQALIAAGAMRPAATGAIDPGRPFDRSHDGFVPSQLAAAVVLEHPGSAAARGMTGWARQTGAATRLAGVGGPEPDRETEEAVMAVALRRAGLTGPGSRVDYVNAHGTASPRGDACELAALAGVFAGSPAPLVNSTKALLGHGITSAGLVEYVTTALQIRERFLHPMPHLHDPLPHPGLRLVARGDPAAGPAAALTANYGFGGIHAAAVLTAPAGGDRVD